MKKIFISVGEISGDNYASKLIKLLPEYEWIGITGPKMRQEGCKSIENIENISVVGITEAIPKYFQIKKAFKKAVKELDKGVDLVIVVDFPGFNLKLLEEAKKRNIKTVYFIAPQVWAWGKGRIPKIVKNTDILISIWPFEKDIYEKYEGKSFKLEYIGHPLLDIIETKETDISFRQKAKIPENKKIIGLLPGSRESEVKTLFPIMLKSAQILIKKYKNIMFSVPTTPNVETFVKNTVKEFPKVPVKILTKESFENPSYEVMKHSFFSIIASGTATLEASIVGNPFILVYKVSPLTFFIGKILVSIDFLGLPNIIANKEIVKELLQKECSPENIANWTEKYLEDKYLYEKTKKELYKVKKALGEKGALKKASQIIKDLI